MPSQLPVSRKSPTEIRNSLTAFLSGPSRDALLSEPCPQRSPRDLKSRENNFANGSRAFDERVRTPHVPGVNGPQVCLTILNSLILTSDFSFSSAPDMRILVGDILARVLSHE
jgi:hypothetical protein